MIAEVGGVVDESSATLAIYGDDLDPVDVTRLLGVEPTKSFLPGHRPGPRSPAIKHGNAWNRGFALSAETIALIARLGVPMEFDLYGYTAEDA